jgi:hypothetical protein
MTGGWFIIDLPTLMIIIIIPSGNLTYGKWPIETDDV